jgi:hypothetical protein
MTKLGFRSLCCVLALACASAPLLLTGCSNADQGEVAEDGGEVQLALTTTGPDGAVYGFPDQTYLQLTTATSNEWIPLWGSDTVLSKTLPAGAYSASIYFQNGNVELTRTDGTVTSVVGAEWTNPQPVTFNIVKGQTTPLAMHFSVDTLVDLVFDTGTLQVIADVVEQDTEQPATARVSGSTNLWYEVYGDDTAAYATALDVDQGVELALSIGFHATGPWQQFGSYSVCQPGTVTDASGGSSPGLDLRLRQLVGGVANLCVYETGAQDQVSLYPSNYGPAPVGQELFLPDAAYGFYGGFYGYVSSDIYDGTTLKQTELQNATLSNGFFYQQIYDAASQQISTIQGTMTGTIQLQP